jgi:secondary thiamine-phosphate synthase enzyme
MPVITSSIQISTRGDADIHDITGQVVQSVALCDLPNGIVTVFCPSSTSAVTTIEYESGALKDLRRLFDEIADSTRHYEHNARWGDGNGHSHVRAALLGPSLTIPFTNRRLALGAWQQIIYIDFDNRPRNRELVVQIMGE